MKFKILDVGCGIDPEGEVNIDITNVVEEYGNRPPRFIIASACSLPFKDKSFIEARCNDLIEHLEDEEIIAVLKELNRVADRVIIKIPNAYFIPGSWKYSWTTLNTDYRRIMRNFPHKQVFDTMMLREALEPIFKKVSIRGWGCWIDIPVLKRILAFISPVVPFLSQVLIAYCESKPIGNR